LNEELYTPQEVADLLKIKKSTVYELIKRGDLKCRKIGKQFRIRRDELDEYINSADNDIQPGENGIPNAYNLGKTMEPDKIDRNETIKKTEMNNKPVTNSNITSLELDEGQAKESNGNRGLIICGQDILLEILCNYLTGQLSDLPIYRSYLGSYNGLYALYQGKVDIATAHLWDGETGEYNKEFVKRMLPGIAYRRIHLVSRMQGFYVKEGNPKQIKGFRDLIREDVTLINREKGSGTRILLDQYLMKAGIQPEKVSGYEREVNSHLACGGAVARGGADVAIGNERISKELKGIDFIPIQQESYDLVVKQESMKYNWYQSLIRIINSKEFIEELERLSGYDTTGIGLVLD
jgi:putative molybdopterin biosynthesis protein